MDNCKSDNDFEQDLVNDLALVLAVDKGVENWEGIVLTKDVKEMLISVKEMIEQVQHLKILVTQYQKNLIPKDVLFNGIQKIKFHAIRSSNLAQILVLKCDILIRKIP